MGFLDSFDDPNWIASLMGTGQIPQPAAPPPAPPPPPSIMANAGPYSPNGPAPGSNMLDPSAGRLPMPQEPPPPPPPDSGPQTVNFGAQTDREPLAPTPPPPPRDAFADRFQPSYDQPLRPIERTGGPEPTTSPRPDGPVRLAGPVPQLSGQPPPMPPPGAMRPDSAPPSAISRGGLATMLGLTDPNRRNMFESALSGLGKGLTAVGAQHPGATGAASFAAGAGGALTGGTEHMRATRNDLFNQSSTAFRDILASNADERAGGKAVDDHMLSQARANYYNSIAKMKAAGGAGSNAWQNTPYGKAAALETMLDKWDNSQRLQLQAKWKASGSTPDEVKADLAELEKKKTAERDRRAKSLGISPSEYKKGTSRPDAFDMEKLSPEQRNILPDGAWYRYKDPKNPAADKDGYVYKQRDWLTKPPYEGWQPQSDQQAPAQPQTQPQRAPFIAEDVDHSVMS